MAKFRLDPRARAIAMDVLLWRQEPDSSFERLTKALSEGSVGLLCVMNDDVKPVKGKNIWATARKIGGREAYAWTRWTELMVPAVLVIEINEEMWGILNASSREALIAHELLHFTADCVKGGWRFGTIGHDLEEFKQIVSWYGVDWRPSLREFADRIEAARTGQTSLRELIDEETGEIVDASHEVNRRVAEGSAILGLSRPAEGIESVTFSHVDPAGQVFSSATIHRPS